MPEVPGIDPSNAFSPKAPALVSRGFYPWLILIVTFAVYANTLQVPFIFDDTSSIAANPTIRHLSSLSSLFSPPGGGLTVAGRPILNVSLAINYALSGINPWGYHLFNLFIHAGGALALFGVVRRTLQGPILGPNWGDGSTSLAGMVSLLWAVHPLQTEAVTYVIQRAESLMALWFLLTFYLFIRGTQSARPTGWYALAIFLCAVGMATKEVMVSVPLLLFLYDRTFVSGNFVTAFKTRWTWFAGFFATWSVLAYLVFHSGGNRGGSIGFGVGVSWWTHFITQPGAILHYLRLVVWPHPLIFEYEPVWVHGVTEVVVPFLLVGALALGTVIALFRWPAVGFLGVWFFSILAPTSLMPAPSQLISEHRMYLPLASVLVVLAALGWRFVGPRALIVFAGLAVVCSLLTISRNHVYQSEISLWRDTLSYHPNNALIHELLAQAFDRDKRYAEGIAEHQDAISLYPQFVIAHANLADDLLRAGHHAEAVEHYTTALHFGPDYIDANNGYGVALMQEGKLREAIAYLQHAIDLKPSHVEAHFNLGNALVSAHQLPLAVVQFQFALRLRRDYPEAHFNLANTLLDLNQPAAAVSEFEAALRDKPAYPKAHYNLANTLVSLHRRPEAIEHYRAAVQLQPDFEDAYVNLGSALLEEQNVPQAIQAFRSALAVKPEADDVRAVLQRLESTGLKP